MLCALHRAIVASVQFPATVAVLPHALRILERDSTGQVESVRTSAVRGLAEVEGIIHSRLPPQKRPPVSNVTAIEEAIVDLKEDELDEESDKLVSHSKIVIAQGIPNGDEEKKSDPEPEIPKRLEIQPRQPDLPSFVTASEATPRIVSNIMPNTDPSGQKRLPSAPAAAGNRDVKKDSNDVYNAGAWKSVRTDETDEDAEIPEIDMGFDSDED